MKLIHFRATCLLLVTGLQTKVMVNVCMSQDKLYVMQLQIFFYYVCIIYLSVSEHVIRNAKSDNLWYRISGGICTARKTSFVKLILVCRHRWVSCYSFLEYHLAFLSDCSLFVVRVGDCCQHHLTTVRTVSEGFRKVQPLFCNTKKQTADFIKFYLLVKMSSTVSQIIAVNAFSKFKKRY